MRLLVLMVIVAGCRVETSPKPTESFQVTPDVARAWEKHIGEGGYSTVVYFFAQEKWRTVGEQRDVCEWSSQEKAKEAVKVVLQDPTVKYAAIIDAHGPKVVSTHGLKGEDVKLPKDVERRLGEYLVFLQRRVAGF